MEQRETLSQGGEPPSRLRRGLVIAAVAGALAVGSWSLVHREPSTDRPGRPPDRPAAGGVTPEAPAPVGVHRWPAVRFPDVAARDDTPPLEAATYELRPSWLAGDPAVRVRTFEGWYAGEGPVQWAGRGFAGLLVLDVTGVMSHPCASAWRSPVPEETAPLVEALTRMPRLRVTTPPEQVDGFGHPTTYLRLRAGPGARCPDGAPLELLDTVENGVVVEPGPATVHEIWVVDVAGHPLLVMASTTPGTPPRTRHQLAAMVDSLEPVPGGEG